MHAGLQRDPAGRPERIGGAERRWHGRRLDPTGSHIGTVAGYEDPRATRADAQDPIGAAITTAGTLHKAFAGVASLRTVVAMALAAAWLLARPELRPLAFYSGASVVLILALGLINAAATASSSPIMGLLERVTIFTFTLWLAITSVVLVRATRTRAISVTIS